MIKIEIETALGSVLFSYEKENNTIKDTLEAAVAADANLRDANLRGANLRDANLSGANLRDANLSDANLRDANLSGAYLRDANLRDANLSGANLSDAYLSDANLRDANLSDANLRDAYLRDANLRDANLRDANLSGANLSDAYLEPYKRDIFDVLLRGIPEISYLKDSIIKGKIDGSVYSGDCCCLNGTLCVVAPEADRQRLISIRDSGRPAEMFFAAIKPGDTPENSQFCKLALEWIEEFEGYVLPATSAVPA